MSKRKKVKNSVNRLITVGLAFLIQTAWIIIQLIKLNKYSVWISSITSILTACVVMWIYLKEDSSDMKLSWIMLILIFPVMGLSLYLLYGTKGATKGKYLREEKVIRELDPWMEQDAKTMERLKGENMRAANQAGYLYHFGGAPLYQNTDVVFYKEAKDGFEAQLEAIKKAEKFIFMEYHAIEDAESFGRLKKLLSKKAAEGVEVRIFYDDVGSIGFINPGFIKEMEQQGIQCRIFNRILPILQIFMNNRDHRKITVIDGKVGFTGGYNLADEYFNLVHPYGYWKDTGIRMEGDAVKSLTVMFLQMWNFIKHTDTDYDAYLNDYEYTAKETGYLQPYADSPLDGERTGENVYLNIIKNATNYVYFMTPYLILSNDLSKELILAAKRGVDVRIITPGIPDKKMIYRVTRSYYEPLLRNGVKIYEFSPGFCHAKQCICDDEIATVGTINLDFRSMYHHFENGVWMYGVTILDKIKEDFWDTFARSQEVTDEFVKNQGFMLRTGNGILRLFSTLM